MSRRIGGLVRSHLLMLVAVLTVLGGSAWAAVTLPKNAVGTKQLKNGAVTGAKIKNGAVTGAKIKNGAVTGAKINLSTLPAVPLARDAQSLGGLASSAFQ